MNQLKRLEILTRLRVDNPYPITELAYTTPFEFLISVLLSAKSTDIGVNKATKKLFAIANTPDALLALGSEGIKECIKTIGLFNKKSENIINTCCRIMELHGGEVPKDRPSLEALPGVGRKTVNVVMNTIFGYPSIAVDTHVYRVCNRTGFALGKNVDIVERKLMKVVPSRFKVNFHRRLILHGRNTCIARRPRCGSCVIEDLCEFVDKV